MPRASTLIISLVVVSLAVAVITSFLAAGAAKYDVPFTGEQFEVYVRFSELQNTTKSIQEQTERAGTSSGLLDILGGFFRDAYQSLKLVGQSYKTINVMSDEALKTIPLGENTQAFKSAANLIVLVLVFIVIILGAIIKSQT